MLDLRHFTWVENPVCDVNNDKTFECLDANLLSQRFHTYQVSIARHWSLNCINSLQHLPSFPSAAVRKQLFYAALSTSPVLAKLARCNILSTFRKTSSRLQQRPTGWWATSRLSTFCKNWTWIWKNKYIIVSEQTWNVSKIKYSQLQVTSDQSPGKRLLQYLTQGLWASLTSGWQGKWTYIL